MYCIGLDVHTAMTTVCVMDSNGKIVREKVIRGPLQEVVSAVAALQKELGAVRICYEASTAAGWLWDRLQGAGRTVLVAHPGKVRMIFRAKRKNDRIDARKLAFLTFVDQVPLAHIPSAARREWRGVIEYRRRLVEKQGGIKSRLRAILRSQAIQAPRGLWSKAGGEWLSKVELGMGQTLQRDLLLLELQQVRETIGKVEKVLQKIASQEPGVTLLKTIPGVGIRTAEAVVAYIDQADRFRRTKSVGCYFGLVPCEDTSVKSRLGHITKEGPPTVRKYLAEATWQAIRREESIRAFFERVRRADPKRTRIALVATAHHLLRVMLAMLRSGECWRAPAPASRANETGKQKVALEPKAA